MYLVLSCLRMRHRDQMLWESVVVIIKYSYERKILSFVYFTQFVWRNSNLNSNLSAEVFKPLFCAKIQKKFQGTGTF